MNGMNFAIMSPVHLNEDGIFVVHGLYFHQFKYLIQNLCSCSPLTVLNQVITVVFSEICFSPSW